MLTVLLDVLPPLACIVAFIMAAGVHGDFGPFMAGTYTLSRWQRHLPIGIGTTYSGRRWYQGISGLSVNIFSQGFYVCYDSSYTHRAR